MLRALHACEDVISSSAAGSAPKASLRELVKHTSDAGGEDTHVVAQEREDVWRRAVTHRKTWISVVYVQSKTSVGIAEALKKASGTGAYCRDFKNGLPGALPAFLQKGTQGWIFL